MEVAKKEDEKKDAEIKEQTLKVFDVLLYLESLKSKRNRLWNIDWQVGEFLKFLTSIVQPKNVLEFGTSNGFSGIWLSINSQKVYSLDSREKIVEEAKLNFKNAGVENIEVVLGSALESLDFFEDIKFDFIFIDANKPQYIDYIKKLEDNDLISDNCIVVADNVLSHKDTTKDYVEYVMEKYDSFILDLGKGLCISKINKK